MGDINGLKLINDAFGHLQGDQAIIQFGNILQNHFSKYGKTYRIGGDEFAIILPSTNHNAVKTLIKRIQQELKKSSFKYGSVSISFGYSSKENEDDIEEEEVPTIESEFGEMPEDVPKKSNNSDSDLFEQSLDIF